MDLSRPEFVYILLVIPTLFASAVVGQGVYKISKKEPDGMLALVFGIIFCVLIALAYYFFIR